MGESNPQNQDLHNAMPLYRKRKERKQNEKTKHGAALRTIEKKEVSCPLVDYIFQRF